MLDALHEDTNTARKPIPYEEIKESESDPDIVLSDRWWMNYSVRNRSFVKDLFCGQLRSCVTCSRCNHVSRCFDPFWDLSVCCICIDRDASDTALYLAVPLAQWLSGLLPMVLTL
jgi:ubiquitin C-terminal hydrolase